jgi:F-type H+-transporting ATPase subunit a
MGLNREISLLIGPARFGANILVIALFLFILFNNFIGLFPYIFTATRHLAVTLRLAVPL